MIVVLDNRDINNTTGVNEMTTAQSKNLKPGQYVHYCGVKAMVRFIRPNGVTVDFWGSGLQEGQCVVRRVSASSLEMLPA